MMTGWISGRRFGSAAAAQREEGAAWVPTAHQPGGRDVVITTQHRTLLGLKSMITKSNTGAEKRPSIPGEKADELGTDSSELHAS